MANVADKRSVTMKSEVMIAGEKVQVNSTVTFPTELGDHVQVLLTKVEIFHSEKIEQYSQLKFDLKGRPAKQEVVDKNTGEVKKKAKK